MLPYNAGSGAVSPVTALFVTQVLGGDVASVATVSTLTGLASIPASEFWGRLSDSLRRRRPFIVLGMLGFGIPTLLQAMTSNLLVVYALAFCIGFVSLAVTPTASALIVETTAKDRWGEAFALYSRAGGMGAVLGLVVGSLWLWQMPVLLGSSVALRLLLGLAGVAAIIGAVLAWVRIPASVGRATTASNACAGTSLSLLKRLRGLRSRIVAVGLPSVAGLRGSPVPQYYSALFLLRICTTLALTPFAVFMRQELGAPEWVVMAAYLLQQVVPTVTYQAMARVGQRTGAVRLMALCASVRAMLFVVGGLVALAATGPLTTAAAVVMFGLVGLTWAGIAVAGPTALMQMARAGSHGSAMGTYNAVAAAGNIVGAFASGQIALHLGYQYGFFLASAAGLTGAALFWLLRVGEARVEQPSTLREAEAD